MKGISHITLICKDINKSAELFCDLFDAEEVYSSDEHNFSISNEKFLLIDDLWIALMQGNPIERSYNHIAFYVDESKIPDYKLKIEKYGLEISQGRPRDEREGKSIYFYDCNQVISQAKEGNLQAAKIILDRLLPPRKDRLINIKLPFINDSSDALEAVRMICFAVGNGEITPLEGEALCKIIEIQNKSIELYDFEKRLQAVEDGSAAK